MNPTSFVIGHARVSKQILYSTALREVVLKEGDYPLSLVPNGNFFTGSYVTASIECQLGVRNERLMVPTAEMHDFISKNAYGEGLHLVLDKGWNVIKRERASTDYPGRFHTHSVLRSPHGQEYR